MALQKFRTSIAELCGLNAAVTAEILWEHFDEQMANGDTEAHFGYDWCRCSQAMIAVISGFCLSKHMVKDAIKELIKRDIIRKDCFNDSRFDRTNWYTFTEYGVRLMMEGEEV